MKFMQRAAAAKPPTSPSTRVSDSDDGHSSKRRKTAECSSPGASEIPSYIVDKNAARAALEEEDHKRQVAMDRMAERLGDSRWVLDTAKLPSSHNGATPLKVVQVGFSEIDKREKAEDELEEEVRAFKSYGPKKKTPKAKASPPTPKSQTLQSSSGADVFLQSDNDSDSDSDSGSDSESDTDSDSDEPDSSSSSEESRDETSQSKPGRTSYGTLKRDEIRSRKAAAQEKSRKMASDRRMKEVNLHKLTSISGGGTASFSSKSSIPGPRR